MSAMSDVEAGCGASLQVKQGMISGHPLIDTRRLIRADSNFLDLIRHFPTAFLTSNPYPYNVMCAVM